MLSKPVFLDYNATTPVHPELLEQIPRWLSVWGNPSSTHFHGREAKKLLREARQNFANLIGCHPLEVIFTSGGSEANNTVIKGALHSELARERKEIITTAIEHPSVLEAMDYAELQGFVVHKISLQKNGEFDFSEFQQKLSAKTLLVSVMSANNETGIVLPIQQIAQLAKSQGALVHTDAVQMLGRLPFRVDEVAVDFATFSAHKFYALKGSGVLFSRRGQGVENLIHGGGQERGRRAGTENTIGIAALGFMAKKLSEKTDMQKIESLRNEMEEKILQQIPGSSINARDVQRLPNTSSLVMEGVDGDSLLMSLDVKGFSVSAGSACSSGSPEPSHVLTALGLSREQVQSSLRVSLGWMTTQEEVSSFVDTLKATVEHLRQIKTQSEVRHG